LRVSLPLRRSLYWSSSSVAPHRTPFTWGRGVCSFCARDFRSSGLEQARIELQVVILEWLGTAAKLALHLAHVSQVDHFARALWMLSIPSKPARRPRWPNDLAALTADFAFLRRFGAEFLAILSVFSQNMSRVASYCPKSSDYVHVSRKGIVLGRLRDAEM